MTTAILLMAHGSRRDAANRELADLAALIAARRQEYIVEIAYLELAQPDIPSSARRCVERGATEIRMLPYFLSPGAHVREDLTALRDVCARRYPTVTFRLCPPLGLHPLLVEILLERLEETG